MTETDRPLLTEPQEYIVHKAVPLGSEPSHAQLTITNQEQSRAAFKIKSSKRDLFTPIPVMGIIEPGASVTVDLRVEPLENPSKPPDRLRYDVVSILTDLDDPKAAWDAAVQEGHKAIGKIRKLTIRWAGHDEAEEAQQQQQGDTEQQSAPGGVLNSQSPSSESGTGGGGTPGSASIQVGTPISAEKK